MRGSEEPGLDSKGPCQGLEATTSSMWILAARLPEPDDTTPDDCGRLRVSRPQGRRD